MTLPVDLWNSAYDNRTAPWVIGEPQPAIVKLAEDGWIRGDVLDVGCGAGEHTIYLTRLGHNVVGVDLSPSAVAQAEANAAAQGVTARFEVSSALELGDRPRFDTIVDSALFHVFAHDGGDPTAYVRSVRAVCKPGGLVHVLALSDTDPGFGPRIGEAAIRDAFGSGWVVEDLASTHYRSRVTELVADDVRDQGLTVGAIVDLTAWLARIRRV